MIDSAFGALGQQRSTNCIGLDTAFLALGQKRSRNCIGLSMSHECLQCKSKVEGVRNSIPLYAILDFHTASDIGGMDDHPFC